MNTRPRVYVAGAYSADNVMEVLDNIRKGNRLGLEVLMTGFAPFVPWLDNQLVLQLRGNEKVTIDDMYAYSLAWLEVSDVVLVVPGWEHSRGTRAEIARAIDLGLPVWYNIKDLFKWRRGRARSE